MQTYFPPLVPHQMEVNSKYMSSLQEHSHVKIIHTYSLIFIAVIAPSSLYFELLSYNHQLKLQQIEMGAQQSINKDMIQFKNHERVGIYRHLQNNGDNFIEIHRELPNQKIYNDWIERMKDVRLSMVGSDIVFLPVKQIYSKTEFCGSGGTLRVQRQISKIVFEEWENFFKDQIANRRKNQNFYTEEEIWFILYSLVRVGLLYEGKNSKLGDMHPNNIVVTPQGFIRVITKDSLPLELNNFEKIVQQIKTDVYLAPQQMDQLMIQSGVYSVKQPSKADVFSFGVTMLQAITLENCSYLYIRNPLRISSEKLDLYTNIMKERYSLQLYSVIVSALEKRPEKRIAFLQIYEMLRPHEEKILDLQTFSLKGSQLKGQIEKQLSISQSRIPEQSRSINVSMKSPVSPPTQQYFGFSKKK